MLIYSTYWVLETDHQEAHLYFGLAFCNQCDRYYTVSHDYCDHCGASTNNRGGKWHGGDKGYNLEQALEKALTLDVNKIVFNKDVGFGVDLCTTKFKAQHPSLFLQDNVILKLPDIDYQLLIKEFVGIDKANKAKSYDSVSAVVAQAEKLVLWYTQVIETQDTSPISFDMTPREVISEFGEPDHSFDTDDANSLIIKYDMIAFHFNKQLGNKLYLITHDSTLAP